VGSGLHFYNSLILFFCHIGWSALWLLQTNFVFIFVKLAHNGLQICDLAGLKAVSFILPEKFIRSRMFLLLLNPPYPQMCCYGLVYLSADIHISFISSATINSFCASPFISKALICHLSSPSISNCITAFTVWLSYIIWPEAFR